MIELEEDGNAFAEAMLDRILGVGRNLYYSDTLGEYGKDHKPVPAATLKQSNLVGSKSVHGSTFHYPVIDLDCGVVLLDSSTEGHHHLYIQKAVPDDKYWELLKAMVDANLVESGYYNASKAKGQSFAIRPGLRKKRPKDWY